MDLVTQGILGASAAQVGFQKTLGRRALAWGALVGMLPDLDVIVKNYPLIPLQKFYIIGA